MSTFDSITQFNKQFDHLFQNVNQKGFGCGFFSILTVNSFLKNNKYDKHTHENNTRNGILTTVENKIRSGVNFDNLLALCTNLSKHDIMATSIELMVSGILSYEHIFDIPSTKYAIIFLKNEKYFVVLVDNGKYHLRDCHENMQYSFNSFDQLTNRLDEAYQFKSNIDLLGEEYLQYSSIEYIKITEPFQTKKLVVEDISIKNADADNNLFVIKENNIKSNQNTENNNVMIATNNIESRQTDLSLALLGEGFVAF